MSFILALLITFSTNLVITVAVTLYPEVATSLPNFPFTDNDKQCFNRYFERQTEINKQERVRWNCPEKTCDTNLWCCMSFKIVDKIKELEGKVSECQVGWFSQSYVNKAVNTILDTIAEDCKEPYVYGSDECKKMQQSLSSPKNSTDKQNNNNKKNRPPRVAAAVEPKESTIYCSHSVPISLNKWIYIVLIIVFYY